MKFINFFANFLLIIALMFILSNCKEQFDPYADPPWLGGSIIETLEKEGDYTILLNLIRKAGYEESIEKGLFTVFAASDSSFNAYFKSVGIDSVGQLSEQQALQLFTLNVLNTPRSRQQLIYDYSYWHGGWQEANSELGALLFRLNTRSKSSDYYDEVRYFEEFKGEKLKIKGQEKKVPLFSTEFFEEYNGAPNGLDYTYFFPETEWSGLQWYNANIVKAEVKCSNGFVYYLDRVVPEIPSIEEYLKNNQDKYSAFYDLIQRFAIYSFTGEYEDDADKTALYRKDYSQISNIAAEIGPSSQPPYDRRSTFSLYLPNNEILEQYINTTFLNQFSSIDSIPEISLVFLVQSCITSSFDIPSKIERSFVNYYGDYIAIDPYTDVDEVEFLSNGPLYVMNKFYPPRAFESTISPVFFDNKYTTFLYGINNARLVASVTSPELNVTIFAPTNEGLLEGGIRYYKPRKQLESLKEDNTWSYMEYVDVKSFVSDHLKTDNPGGSQVDFSGEGFTKMSSGNYIYYKNNKLQGGGNQEIDNYATILSSKDGDNGRFYTLDKAIISPKYDPVRFIGNDENLSEFFNLLFISGLADTVIDETTEIPYPRMTSLNQFDFWTVFAPTNDAITTARNNGLIPEDNLELQNFLLYHFVKEDVIFDDGVLNGTFYTAKKDSSITTKTYYAPIDIENSYKNLRIVDRTGNNVDVDHNSANKLVRLGVLHKIDNVLLN
ncbi:MAG: fasciclin domain-containing protein [Prolixibacteraceae bacterium]|jgi:uncharacterized surface protein with fasciclin (FAS1) repeats|nr:fasciclin domain-containing protein [Prolixibacteraceae bacterium]